MKNISITLLIISLTILTSCKNSGSSQKSQVSQSENIGEGLRIDVDLTKQPILYTSDLYDTMSYVKLETRPDCMIGTISQLLFIDNKFVISDYNTAKSIFVFDSKGKFLNKIGRQGRGPQEFDSPDDIVFNKYRNELIIWSNNDKKLLTYKPDGSFVSEVKLDWRIYALSVLDENTLILYFNNMVNTNIAKGEEYNFVCVDLKGNVISRQMPFNSDNDKFSGPCQSSFYSYKDSVLFCYPYSNSIFKIYKDTLVLKYFVNYGKQNIPQDFTKGKTWRETNDELKKLDIAILRRYMETDSILYLGTSYKKSTLKSDYNSVYFKKSGSIITSSLVINDLSTIFPVPIIFCASGDSLIGFCESFQFASVNEMYKNASGENKKINEEMRRKFSKVPDGELKDEFFKSIDKAKFNLKQSEIDFVNGIKTEDNPVIVISKLKTK